SYVVIYGIVKRRSIHGTLVGTIPGASSLVAGYLAVTNNFDTGAMILTLIMICWQMPHFYAIAIMGLKGYKEAGIPVLPAVKGIQTTRKQIIIYTVGFIMSTSALTVFGYTGFVYLIVMLVVGTYWLRLALKNPVPDQNTNWAHERFLFSLTTLTTFSIMISIDSFLR
ncbi:MAG: UbiA family prenyltransferase, partial [Patescibacteria group bacterium]